MGAEEAVATDAVMGQEGADAAEGPKLSLRERVQVSETGDEEPIEAFGEKFLVRSMSGSERIAVFKLLKGLRNEKGEIDEDAIAMFPEVIVRTACDPETGERAFKLEDASWLNEKSGGDLQRLGSAGLRVSGMGPEAVGEAGKGSSETPSEGSPTS